MRMNFPLLLKERTVLRLILLLLFFLPTAHKRRRAAGVVPAPIPILRLYAASTAPPGEAPPHARLRDRSNGNSNLDYRSETEIGMCPLEALKGSLCTER
jgi:hypothetical protein